MGRFILFFVLLAAAGYAQVNGFTELAWGAGLGTSLLIMNMKRPWIGWAGLGIVLAVVAALSSGELGQIVAAR